MDPSLLTPFLNRAGEFDPMAWFQLVPKGTFQITRKEGDKIRTYQQVVDDEACERIVGAFLNRQAKTPAYELLVGFEHFAHEQGKSSEAACWVTHLEKRADGVWAKGRWTDIGEAAIKNRRYRYLSPVWFPRQTEPLGGNRFRPVEVNDAGLTNMPNLGDALQPFWNRADENFQGREATTETTKNTAMIKVITLLGLEATATEDEVVSKVQAFMNRVKELEPVQGTLATLQSEHTALKNRHTSLLTASVDKTLVEFEGVITQESKEAWKNRLSEDFDGTVKLLKGIKPAKEGKKPLHQQTKSAEVKTGEEDEVHPFLNRRQTLRG
jgi:phage I-like protein